MFPGLVVRLADLGFEGVRVSVEAGADGSLALLLPVQRVEAVGAVAVVAELAGREAVAVADGSGAVSGTDVQMEPTMNCVRVNLWLGQIDFLSRVFSLSIT